MAGSEVTLTPEDFSIDDAGNLRIELDKAQSILNLLKNLGENAKIGQETFPPKPVVKVEM